MGQYDLYNIENRLREYDPELFRRIDWDDKRKIHKIICYDQNDHEEYTAFTVPGGQLDQRTVVNFMKINPRNGYNAFDEMEKSKEQKKFKEEMKITDMATNLAENILDSFRFKPRRSIE